MSQYADNLRRAKQSKLNREAVDRAWISKQMKLADEQDKRAKAERKAAKRK